MSKSSITKRLNAKLYTSGDGSHFISYNDGEIKIPLVNPEDLRNKSKGKAIILASGPSAVEIEVTRLKSFTTFAVNGSAQLFLEKKVPPDYFAIDDLGVAQSRTELILQGIKSSKVSFVSSEILYFLSQSHPEVIRDNQFVVIYKRSRKPGCPKRPFLDYLAGWFDQDIYQSKQGLFSAKKRTLGFSSDFTKGYFSARTIPYVAAQIAVYMGSKTICFAGMDLQGKERFYEKGAKALPSTLDDSFERFIKPSFMFLPKIEKEKDLRFYNLSINSRLSSKIVKKCYFSELIK